MISLLQIIKQTRKLILTAYVALYSIGSHENVDVSCIGCGQYFVCYVNLCVCVRGGGGTRKCYTAVGTVSMQQTGTENQWYGESSPWGVDRGERGTELGDFSAFDQDQIYGENPVPVVLRQMKAAHTFICGFMNWSLVSASQQE